MCWIFICVIMEEAENSPTRHIRILLTKNDVRSRKEKARQQKSGADRKAKAEKWMEKIILRLRFYVLDSYYSEVKVIGAGADVLDFCL